MPKPSPGTVVLDTHAWLWMVEGDRRQLAPRAIEIIEGASQRGEILVSAI